MLHGLFAAFASNTRTFSHTRIGYRAMCAMESNAWSRPFERCTLRTHNEFKCICVYAINLVSFVHLFAGKNEAHTHARIPNVRIVCIGEE